MRTIRRAGPYFRVADPRWEDPLDGRYAAERGGRWNPPGSFPCVYLCRSVEVARANVHRKLAGQPYGPEDLRDDAAPILVSTRLPEDRYLNVVTDAGCRSVGLPESYPRDNRGRIIGHSRCRRIGLDAWDRGLPGIACRSAAPGAPRGGEELAFFTRRAALRVRRTEPFGAWFWGEGV
jgi:hypothetical protein